MSNAFFGLVKSLFRLGERGAANATEQIDSVAPDAGLNLAIEAEKEKLAASTKRLATAQTQLDSLHAGIDSITNEIAELEANVEERLKRVDELKEGGRPEGEWAPIERGAGEKAERIAKLQGRLEELNAQADHWEKEIETSTEDLRQYASAIEAEKDDSGDLKMEFNMAKLQQSLAESVSGAATGDGLKSIQEIKGKLRDRNAQIRNEVSIGRKISGVDEFDKQFAKSKASAAGNAVLERLRAKNKPATSAPATAAAS